ncbi:MAG TPA: apolipoprotein N-acyltransferase [Frankiaceae bacterium]|nr:apolipoprotein N-acyltransferase [Frankiaceae bacterium]
MLRDDRAPAPAADVPAPIGAGERRLPLLRDGRLAPWAALLAAVVGGVLTALAFPRFSVRPFAVLGPALLIAAVHRQRLRPAAAYGLAYGLTFLVPLLQWLQPGAGTNAWLILSLFQAVIVAVSAAALAAVSRLPGWPVWAAGVWVLQEAVRGRWPFGGFTWGRLAFSQDEGPFLRWMPVAGTVLVTFLVALAAALLVAAVPLLARGRTLPALALLALGTAPALVAPLLPGPPRAERRTVAALVQGNVPRLGLPSNDARQQDAVIRNHVEATFELADEVAAGRVPPPAFVLWPENSTDRDPRTDALAGQLIDAAAKKVGVPIVVGAVLDKGDAVENAGVVWDPATGFGARYVKRHLVPFGEYIPFREVVTPWFGRLALIPRDFVPADRAASDPLDVAGVRLGDVICYEVAYDGLVRDGVRDGAEAIVVQTNNATFGRSDLTHQQLAMSRIRAVEHGRTVLVVATSGVSAVFTPDGRTVDRSEIFTRDLLVHEVPLSTRRTLATTLGDRPELLLAGIGALGMLAAAAGTLRRR